MAWFDLVCPNCKTKQRRTMMHCPNCRLPLLLPQVSTVQRWPRWRSYVARVLCALTIPAPLYYGLFLMIRVHETLNVTVLMFLFVTSLLGIFGFLYLRTLDKFGLIA